MFPEDATMWVLAYKDKGPNSISANAKPAKIAFLFDSEEQARDWWETIKGRLGREPEAEIYPVKDYRLQVALKGVKVDSMGWPVDGKNVDRYLRQFHREEAKADQITGVPTGKSPERGSNHRS